MAMENQRYVLLSILILSFATNFIFGSPDGAPAKACAHLKPKHEGDFQSTPNPCTVKVEKQSDGKYKVTLKAKELKGFALAIKADDSYLGEWEENSDAKILSCPEGNVITHKNNSKKTTVTLTWTPGSDDSSKTKKIFGACVKNYENYWRIEQDL